MKYPGVLLFLLGSLFLTGQSAFAVDFDELLRLLIVGSWTEENLSSYGIATYHADGRYEAKMFASEQQQKLLVQLRGNWRIENGELHNVLSESVPPVAPIGVDFVDEIIQLNHRELILVDKEGIQYTRVKVAVDEN